MNQFNSNETVDKVSDEMINRDLHLQYTPAYAQFLIDQHLTDFVQEQLRLSRELKLPLLKYFESYTEDQIIELGKKGASELLQSLVDNKAQNFIDNSVRNWMANQLPTISRDQIVIEDISLVNLIRRKTFRHFLSRYTTDTNLFIHIMDEIDQFTVTSDVVSFKYLFELQQELYKQAQTLSKIGNWIWDLKTNTLTWSEELYNIYEFDPQIAVTFESASKLNNPDDVLYVRERMKHSLETKEPHDFYYRIILKDGREKILHAKGEVKVDANGEPQRMFGTLQDVTAEKYNEKELNEKQNFIQKIADVTPSLITAYNVNTGKYLFINNALKTLLGYDPQEVLDNGIAFFTGIIHPDDLQPLLAQNTEALNLANNDGENNEIIVEFDYRLRHKDGEYRWFHTYGTIFNRDSHNKVEEILNISVDVTDELMLRKQLEEEKAFAELLIDSSIDQIGAYDINQNIIAWNKRCEEVYHVKKEDVLGKNVLEVFPQLKGKEPIDDLIKALSGTTVHHSEKKSEVGTNGYNENFLIPLRNKQDEIFGALAISHDITELKNKSNELQELNVSFDHAEEIAHMSHWQWNLTTGKLTYSDNQYRLLGCEPQSFEPTIENYLEFVHPEDRALILQGGDQIEKNRQPLPVVFRLIRKDGELRYFESIGKIIVNQFKEKVLVGINQDITEKYLLNKKLSEASSEIKRNEERYHKALNELQDYAILTLDKQGIVLSWNKGAEKVKGYKADEIIGKHFSAFYTEEDRSANRPQLFMMRAKETGSAGDEGWRVRKDGSRFWGSIFISTIVDDKGEITGYLKITRDLTERKIAEDKLVQYANSIALQNEELERSNAELSSFNYIASHDLREPLRKIKMFTDRISKEELSENIKAYFTRIVAAAERMQNLIDALTSYSQVSMADNLFVLTDLNTLLRDVERSLIDDLNEKHVVIESTKLPTLKVIPHQLNQLFTNIISNAIKYSRAGIPPRIKVTCDLIPPTGADILPEAHRYYRIRFSDNGIGFEQQYADKIFELFQRLHGKSEFEGTGIGLAICKKIVRNHNGMITAKGEPGIGATFNIYLPA